MLVRLSVQHAYLHATAHTINMHPHPGVRVYRYDCYVEELASDCSVFPFLNAHAPWLDTVRLILGEDMELIASGCIMSLPGSQHQPWHS